MESWTLHGQKTGFKMFHGDTRIGGWDRRNHHLFILESYVHKLPDKAAAQDILRRLGFQPREQPPGHFWWSIPTAEFRNFVDALIALAGLPAGQIREGPRPKRGPR